MERETVAVAFAVTPAIVWPMTAALIILGNRFPRLGITDQAIAAAIALSVMSFIWGLIGILALVYA